jgi:hypothetical protein
MIKGNIRHLRLTWSQHELHSALHPSCWMQIHQYRYSH